MLVPLFVWFETTDHGGEWRKRSYFTRSTSLLLIDKHDTLREMKFFKALVVSLSCVAHTDAFRSPSRLQKRSFSLDLTNVHRGPTKKTQFLPTNVVMAMAPKETVVESFPPSNIAFGVAWAALLAFTAFLAPGSFGGEADNEMIAKIIENPLQPDINMLFYFVFNLFAIIPVCLASVILPQASDKGAPPAPFLMASAFIGYFALGKRRRTRGLLMRDWNFVFDVENS
jgi:hypothetical protein